MSETAINKRFFEVFPEAGSAGDVSDFFREVRIESVGLYKKTGKLVIKASADRLIPARATEQVEAALSEAFSLNVGIRLRLRADSPLSELLDEYRDSILYKVNSKIAMSRGILNGCTWELVGDRLEITLVTRGRDILKSKGCDRLIEEIVEQSFGEKISVDFRDRKVDEDFRENTMNSRKMNRPA